MTRADISLYAILDPEHCLGRDLAELAATAARNGVSILQYRDKSGDVRAMIANARAIRDALSGSGIPFVINDRVDVALACGADGVHLGQSDMAPADARELLGSEAIIGLSVKTIDDANLLPGELIDHAFIGGVHETVSKDNPAAIGLDGWRERAGIIRRRFPDMSIGAIAGFNAANAAPVIEAGADGIACISSIFRAGDVAAACLELREVVDQALAARREQA